MKIRIRIHLRELLDLGNLQDLRAFTYALQAAVLFGVLAGAWLYGRGGIVVAVLGGIVAFAASVLVVGMIVLGISHTTARAAMAFVAPSGRSTPSLDDYSFEKSLLARGKVDEALTSLEVRLANRPDDAALCLFVADVYAREAHDAAKAERLYRRAREIEAVSPEQDYRATNRLIDLYMGELDDPVRARAELERLQSRHPDTTAAAHARKALAAFSGG